MHNNYLPFFHSSQWNQRWIHGSRGEISLGKSIKRDRCGFIYKSELRFKYSSTPQIIQENFVTVAFFFKRTQETKSEQWNRPYSAVVRDPPFCMEPPAWPLRQNHQPWCNPAKETKIPLVLFAFYSTWTHVKFEKTGLCLPSKNNLRSPLRTRHFNVLQLPNH